MRRYRSRYTFFALAVALAACVVWWPTVVVGQTSAAARTAAGSGTTQKVAEKLQSATVTVRILSRRPIAEPSGATSTDPSSKKEGDAATAAAPKYAADITVCSGVAVGHGFVVTHDDIRASRTAAADRYRITLPDGKQAKARLAVVDQYSQLHLLETDQSDLAGMSVAKAVPKVGARVMSAAAAGIDKPVVSIGMVGAVDRSLPGVYLPPLVQCDIRTLETSTGGAIVDLTGKLVGIVTYTDPPEKRNGWTYAVPASQVARLLRARVKGELIVMGRRRPVVGMKLGVGKKEGVCIVERVTEGGPADLAGIAAGDIVHEAAGRKIRSPYQAVRQVMNRQPGDKLTMLVERNKSTKYVDLTLGGGAATPVADLRTVAGMGLVQQNVNVKPTPAGGYEVSGQDSDVRVVPGQRAPLKMSLDRVETLERELANYREEVARLHKQLRHRDSVQSELQKLIAQMLGEIREMKKMQDAQGQASEASR